MKKTYVTVLAMFAALIFGTAAIAGVESLRGDQTITDDAKASGKHKQVISKEIERSYNIQPPMIPHKIDKDTINLKTNTCMNCHSAATYEKKKAPKAGDSHYITRDDKTLDKVSSRRYFCNQCHALQSDVSPLVDNVFEGAK
ncbi:MAG: nitrate reductase cytochrome c-type subunit [Gammaproteobacteria bacterium]|nr:nitrate reductase cytochrome c-type subunit [Gammaproteobacteria bacterium]